MARRSTAGQPMEGKRGLISVGTLPLYFVRSIISVSIASRVHARSISARAARICGLGAARASRRHSSARILQSSDLSISLLPKTGRSEQPRSGHRAGHQCVRRPGVPTKEGKSVLHRRPRTSRVLEQSYICKSATTVTGAVRAFNRTTFWCATFLRAT